MLDGARLTTVRWFQAVALASCATLGACSALPPANGPYTTIIADGIKPRLTAADAVSISRTYLAAQTPEIAAPELHVVPHITAAWAVTAQRAATVDGCVPAETSTQIVWVTKGVGDYLNLHDLPWSHTTRQAEADTANALTCGGPGPAGTIVIDDATGAILGVYPLLGPYPHPTVRP
jgi:hypothetical protein